MTQLHDRATELALTRAAWIDRELFKNTVDVNDFFDHDLRAVWQAARTLRAAGRPIEFDTMSEVLAAAGVVNPESILINIQDGFESPAYAEAYAETITQWARYRDLLGSWYQIQNAADFGEGEAPPIDHMITALQERLARLRPEHEDPGPAVQVALPDLSECQPLPVTAQLDPELGQDASPWLDAYIGFSRQWAPRAFDGFHEAVGLWVLSTVAARRVKLDFGGERYPSLYLANVARSSVWTKSTAHHIGSALLNVCGLSHLLAPDEATPQALLVAMSQPATVENCDTMPALEREQLALSLAFAGQKGWDFDEFGTKIAAMMRDSGPMADFRGYLRRFDDSKPRYIYATVGRGNNRLERPYLALLASLTPADMAPFAKRGGALWHDGFWARFAFVAPAPEDQPTFGEFPEGQRVFPEFLVRSLRAWYDRLGTPDVDLVQRMGRDGKSSDVFDVTVTTRPPENCTFGAGVWEANYRYYNALTTIAAANANADLDGNYNRFAEKALRVAILLASLENGGRLELRHWARAQAIAERWRQSLHNLYRTLNTGALSEEAEREDQIMDVITRLETGATVNDLRRYIRGLTIMDASRIAEGLVKAGALRVETTRKGSKRYVAIES